MSASVTSPEQTTGGPGRRVRAGRAPRPAAGPTAILFVVLAAQLMAIIDLNIVNVAAPTIQLDLHTSGAGLQLVVAGYVITYAMTLITGARLGDRVGHGRAFRAGLTVFTLASLLCGLAGSSGELIGFRLAQGVGAGVMMPQVMSLIQRTFTGSARLKALGMYSAVIALGAVVGQVAGGALVSADLFGSTWRPIFLLNVPIGIALLVCALRFLPADRGEAGRKLDPAGVVTLSGAVLAIVLPLVLGHQEDWPLWCWLSLGGGVLLLAVFLAVERRVGARGGSPLVAARVIRAPAMIAGGTTVLLTMLSFSGFLFTLTLYLQGSLHIHPFEAGLLFAPAALGTTITSLNWQRVPTRWQGALVPAGLVGSAATYLLLAPIEAGGHRHVALLLVDLFALGLFFGMSYSPVVGMTLRNVAVPDAADASGVLITLLQLGQVLGIATLGTLYLTLTGNHVPAHAAAITFLAVAGCALVAAVAGAVLVRKSA
jgi:MFS family permease